MTSLTDKLKALGVKVGANDLPAPQPALSSNSLLEQVLGGHTWPTHLGETYAVEAHYPVGQSDIHTSLELSAPLQVLAEWAGDARIQAMPVAAFAFLDTETTGLSGGTGTYPFLVGVGRFEHGETGDEFHLAQFFLRDPLEEPAQLAALEEFLAPCQAIVTFNGKAFDAPLLNTRYTVHGWRAPLADLAHIDLLHLARRLWHDRIPSRTLSNLEYQILGTARSEQDIPGWDIPRIYRQYLNSGDPGELRRVFYHNAMDVISLAALMNHMASLLANPLELGNQHGVDLIALARLFEDLGQIEAAAALYVHGLGHEDALTQRMPRPVLLQAIGRLALIHKRRGEWEKAIQLWQQAAYHQHLDAFIELAKCHEHIFKDYPAATRWTQAAADLVNSPNAQTGSGTILTPYERRQWLADLQHRLDRLQKLASRSQSRPQSPAP